MPTNQGSYDEQATPAGVRLKRLRERTGMSLRATARALGLGSRYTTYRAYEENRKRDVLPVPLVRRLLPVFVGQGNPAVKEEDLWSLAGVPKCYLRPRAQTSSSGGGGTPPEMAVSEASGAVSTQECEAYQQPNARGVFPLTPQEKSFVLRLRSLPPPVRHALHTLAYNMPLDVFTQTAEDETF